MNWNILIIAEPEIYDQIVDYYYKIIPHRMGDIALPYIRKMKGEAHIHSGVVTIDLYPWNGMYHWRGYKSDLVYIPKALFDDRDLLAQFQINAIYGTVLPVENILMRFGINN